MKKLITYNMDYIPSKGKLYTVEAAEKRGIKEDSLDDICTICRNGHKYPKIMGPQCPLCEMFEYDKVIHECPNGHKLVAVGPGEPIPLCQICRIERNLAVYDAPQLCENNHKYRGDLQRRSNGCPDCGIERISPSNPLAPTLCVNGHSFPFGINNGKQCTICRIEKQAIKNNVICSRGHRLPGCIKKGSKCPLCRKQQTTPEVLFQYCNKKHKYPLIQQNEGYKRGCPVCSYNNRMLSQRNPLMDDSNRIFDENRNGDVTVEMLSDSSNYYVWWRCEKSHYWVASVNRHASCPYCEKQLPWPGETDLATVDPSSIEKWCYAYNGDLKPEYIMPTSNIARYMKCGVKHIYVDEGYKRGCPYCSNKIPIPNETDLGTLRPDLFEIYDEELNGDLKLCHLTYSSSYKFYAKCKRGHSFIITPNNLANRSGEIPQCPRCQILDSHYDGWDELEKEWDSNLNGNISLNIISGHSAYRGVWSCVKGHKYISSVAERKKNGCPYCSGKLPTEDNSLAVCCPELAKQLHPFLNGDLRAEHLTPFSNIDVWWIDKENNAWKINVNNRRKKESEGPFISRKLPSSKYNLKNNAPDIAERLYIPWMWDVKAENLLPSSTKRVWLKCKKKGHIFHAVINNLAGNCKSDSCTYCGLKKPVIGENDLGTLSPNVAQEWDHEKNKDLPEDNFVNSSKKRSFICPDCGHPYDAYIQNRTRRGDACPRCRQKKQK